MNTKALFVSVILMCASGVLSAQIYDCYLSENFFDDTVKVIKHVSLEDSLFYASLSDTIIPSRSDVTGDTRQNPIQSGTYSDSFHYSDTQNTMSYTNQYQGRNTFDVFYRLVLTVPMNVTFTHEGSVLSDTYMYLLNSNGNLIASNDDYSGEGHCSNTRNSFIRRQLAAGTYYVVSEGYFTNGIITTNITGFASTEYGYTSIPSAYSTESGTAVGGMGGAFSVSPMGGATYTIPIEVPQGVGGLQPQLSIVYNSQAGNGLCGYGANLSGLSAITRGPKDIYHDGSARGVSYGTDDALFLSGERLILSSGTAGQDGAEYTPESDPFTKVTLHVINGSGSSNTWFEVKSRDGMTYWYGADSYSRLSYPYNGVQKVLCWYLSRIIDPLGNYADYYYVRYDNYIYLYMIAYGVNGNQSNGLVNTIQFSYESRNDSIPVRFDGRRGSIKKRLKTITSKTNDNTYRTYTLNYNTTGDGSGTQYSRLTGVTESNGSNESLATELTWSYLPSPTNNTLDITVCSPTNIPSEFTLDYNNQAFFSGDMNGDGVDDLISLTPATTVENGWTSHFNILNFHYSTLENGSRVFKTSSEVSSDYFEVDWLGSFMGMSNKQKGELVTDFNGDGINECILPVFIESGPGYHDDLRIQVLGKNFCDSQNWELQAKGEPLTTTADINNDGKGDLVVLEAAPYNGTYCLRIYQLRDNYVPGSHYIFKYAESQLSLSDNPTKLYATDMNGNGATDLLVVYGDGYTIYWNEGNCSFSESSRTDGVGSLMDEMCETGDFDGDGLMDFLTNEWGTHTWYFHLNNGDGTFNCFPAMTFCLGDQDFTSSDDDKFHFEVLDFDGDGKSDVVITKADYERKTNFWNEWGEFSKTYTYWYKSTGTSLDEVRYASSNNDYDAYQWRFNTGDFDGDGHRELINFGYDCAHALDANSTPSWHIYRTSNLSAQTGKVTFVTGDFGARTGITYSTLTDTTVYTRGTAEPYPAPRYTIPLNVVKQTVLNNGAAGNLTTRYAYEGLKVHLRGRGMLGFSKSTVTCTTMGTVTENGITQWDTAHYIPKVTYARTTIGNEQSQTTNTMTVVNKGGKRYFAYRLQTVETDFDGNTVSSVRSYDTDYGYLKGDTTTYGTNMFRSVTYSDYILAGGSYHPRTVVTTQRHPDDTSPFSRTTTYSYGSNGLVTRKTENRQSADSLATYYTYDVFGNLTGEVSTGTGITTPLTTYYTYDATHRFPVRIYTSPASTVQKYTYDLWGNVLTSQDSINQSITNTVTHTYDAWGNLIRTQAPDGTETTYTRGWNNSSSQRWFILKQGTSSPWVKTWYDNHGREVKTESVGPKDVAVSSTTTFNSKGLASGRTDINGNLTLSYSYEYDARGRITSETLPGNSTVTYSYGSNGRTKTVNDNGKQTTYTYDAMGNLKQVQGPAYLNKVTYKYSSNGGIKSAVAAGSTWTFGYDNRGNRISINDPDAGETIYTYDALGREITRTDARGVVFSTNYDYLGRVTSTSASQSGNTETVTYQYGTSGTGQSRLTGKTLGNFISSYEYDQYGRLTMESNGVHSVSYQYSASGLVSRMTWNPNNSTDRYVDYTYDSYGNCIGQSAISGIIQWNLTSNTGTSTTSTMRLHSNGTVFTKNTTLDSNGNLSSQTLLRGGVTLGSGSYTFSATTGNLTSRTLNGTTHTFIYDNMDRLTHVNAEHYTEMTMSYSVNGNISSKSGIGSYEYNTSGKPHAVTAVANSSGLIDTEIQSIDYNLWGKVTEVNAVKGNDTYKYEITYGPDQQRILTVLWKNNQLVHLITYGRDYEERYLTTHIARYYYVSGTDGNAAVYVSDIDVEEKAYCIETDHLGSITALYDQYGTKCFSASYDVWGKRTIGISIFDFDRGFTGHEHIDEIDLINMNGRVYDPYIGRFLSPDAFVQSPSNPQNYNRYSYCLNNPLKYTDPSGELFGIDDAILGIALGAIIGGYSGYKIGEAKGATGWDMAGYIAGGVLIGGVSGYGASTLSIMGVGAGGIGAITGTFSGAMYNGLANGFNAENLFKGALSGVLAGWLGGYSAAAIGGGWGALVGGSASNLTNQIVSQSLYYDPKNPNHNRISINWKSVILGGLSSFCSYHVLSSYSYLKGGNQLNGHRITYKQYCTMNADFQRSRSLRKEYGGWLKNDGSVERWPSQNRHALSVDPTNNIPDGTFASYHTHWAKPGNRYLVINGKIVKKLSSSDLLYKDAPECLRYHSPDDQIFHQILGIDSFVINRYDYSFSPAGNGATIGNDVFLRFFLFGY